MYIPTKPVTPMPDGLVNLCRGEGVQSHVWFISDVVRRSQTKIDNPEDKQGNLILSKHSEFIKSPTCKIVKFQSGKK